MELKQFINQMQQNVGLRAMLPVHQGMLYPYFTIINGRLCAHFLTNASKIIPEGLVQYHPEFYIVSCYPHADIRCIQDLKFAPAFSDVDFTQSDLLEKKSDEERAVARQEFQKLNRLAAEVLDQWDREGNADLAAYNQQLGRVLTERQYQLYLRVIGSV